MKKPVPTTESYASGNITAAKAVLSRPDLHPEGSLARNWAEKIKAAHFRAVDAELDRESRETAMSIEGSISDEN